MLKYLSVAAIAYGCWLLHPAAGWIMGGLLFGATAGYGARRRRRQNLINDALRRGELLARLRDQPRQLPGVSIQ